MEKGIKNGHGFLKCTLGTSCDHLLAGCQFLVHYLIFCLEEKKLHLICYICTNKTRSSKKVTNCVSYFEPLTFV